MEHLRRRKLNPHLGVEIDCTGVDLTKPLSREGVRSLFESLMGHKVVALRKTGLTTALQHQELARQLQACSLEGTGVERLEELAFEPDGLGNRVSPFGKGALIETAPGVSLVGPWPTKKGAIGNAVFHADQEFWQHGCWFTSLRMVKIPRDPKTGEVLPCGDTMWADMTVAWEDLPEEEKQSLEKLRCVYDWKVAIPHIKLRAEQGVAGYAERLAALNELYPPVERPLVRPHPVTGKKALMASPAYASHIVGMTQEDSLALLQRIMRLCEVPEYQLRLPWQDEGDVIIMDNYVLHHRVVADFYNIPAESRLLENIATKGHPQLHNVLCPGAEIQYRAVHHEVQQQQRSDWSSTKYMAAPGVGTTQDGSSKL